jgi:hypothetical protein
MYINDKLKAKKKANNKLIITDGRENENSNVKKG